MFTYRLSIPIDDRARLRQIEKQAATHNRKGMLAPFVRDLLYDILDGKFVRIDPATVKSAAGKGRKA